MGLGEIEDRVWGPQDFAVDEDANAYAVFEVPANRKIEIISAKLCAEAAVADQDTNYNTYSLRNNSVSANMICELLTGPAATGTTIAVAPTAMSAPAAAQKEVGSTTVQIVYLESTKTGSGLAVPGLSLHMRFRWIE